MKSMVGLALVAFALVACAPPDAERLGTARDALTVCPGATTLKGLDVSHYDNTVDWSKVAASGRAFAIAKATEGDTFVDPQFATNWAGMKQAGVVRSAYHFFHSTDDPIVQADHLLATMGTLEPGDLPPTLDLEVTDGSSPEVVTSTTIAWLDHIAAATKTKPILYTSPSFVTDHMGNPPGLEDHATLWVAHWNVSCPDIPTPFASWSFWQTGSGTVPGDDAGPADVDVFNGDQTALAALTVQAAGGGGSGGGGGAGGGGGKPPHAGASSSTSTTSAGAGGGGGAGGMTSSSSTSDTDSGCSTNATGNSGSSPLAAIACLLALAVETRRRRAR